MNNNDILEFVYKEIKHFLYSNRSYKIVCPWCSNEEIKFEAEVILKDEIMIIARMACDECGYKETFFEGNIEENDD